MSRNSRTNQAQARNSFVRHRLRREAVVNRLREIEPMLEDSALVARAARDLGYAAETDYIWSTSEELKMEVYRATKNCGRFGNAVINSGDGDKSRSESHKKFLFAIELWHSIAYTGNGTFTDADRFGEFVNQLKRLSHRNITTVKNLELLHHPPNYTKLLVIREHCNQGSLEMLLSHVSPLPRYDTFDLAFKIISGMEYLHANNIIIGNLRPATILLTSDKEPKISHFYFGVTDAGLQRQMSIGRNEYSAPELFGSRNWSKERDGIVVDVWSFSVIFYRMLTGSLPFGRLHAYKIYMAAAKDDVNISKISIEEGRSVAAEGLKLCPSDRAALSRIKSHVNSFLNEYREAFRIPIHLVEQVQRGVEERAGAVSAAVSSAPAHASARSTVTATTDTHVVPMTAIGGHVDAATILNANVAQSLTTANLLKCEQSVQLPADHENLGTLSASSEGSSSTETATPVPLEQRPVLKWRDAPPITRRTHVDKSMIQDDFSDETLFPDEGVQFIKDHWTTIEKNTDLNDPAFYVDGRALTVKELSSVLYKDPKQSQLPPSVIDTYASLLLKHYSGRVRYKVLTVEQSCWLLRTDAATPPASLYSEFQQYDFIFMPSNYTHETGANIWTLTILDVKNNLFFVLDPTIRSTRTLSYTGLRLFREQHEKVSGTNLNTSKWQGGATVHPTIVEVNQRHNSSVAVLMFLASLLNGEPLSDLVLSGTALRSARMEIFFALALSSTESL